MLYSGLDEVPGASDEKKSEKRFHVSSYRDCLSSFTAELIAVNTLSNNSFSFLSTKENKDLTVISQT